jgi:hypothetical protein
MLYILIPHKALSQDEVRMFTSFGVAEQVIFTAARAYAAAGQDPDWCSLTAYTGVDELYPVFFYTIVGVDRLEREAIPSPSP